MDNSLQSHTSSGDKGVGRGDQPPRIVKGDVRWRHIIAVGQPLVGISGVALVSTLLLFFGVPMLVQPKQFYYRSNGSVVGPMTGVDLRESAFVGNVKTVTLVANDPAGPWVEAGRIRGLFDANGKPLPHPTATPEICNARQGDAAPSRVPNTPETIKADTATNSAARPASPVPPSTNYWGTTFNWVGTAAGTLLTVVLFYWMTAQEAGQRVQPLIDAQPALQEVEQLVQRGNAINLEMTSLSEQMEAINLQARLQGREAHPSEMSHLMIRVGQLDAEFKAIAARLAQLRRTLEVAQTAAEWLQTIQRKTTRRSVVVET